MRLYKDTPSLKIFMLIAVTGWLLNILMNALLSNALSMANFGNVIVTLTLLTTLGSLFTLGLTNFIPSILPKICKDNPQSQINFLAWCLEMISLTAVYTYASVSFALLLFYFGILPYNDDFYHISFSMLLLAPFFALFLVINTIMAVSGKTHWSELIQQVLFPLTLVSYFFVIKLFGPPNLIMIIIMIFASTLTLLFITGLVFFHHQKPITLRLSQRQATPQKKQWSKTSLTFAITSFYSLITSNSPVFLLEWLATSENQVGAFGAIMALQGLVTLVRNIIHYGIFHFEAQNLIIKDRKKLQQRITQTNQQAYGLCFIITCAILAFGDDSLGIFGEAYKTYKPALFLLFGVNLVSLVGDSSWILCSMLESGPGFLKKLFFYQCVVGLVSNSVFCYFYGLNGLALSLLILEIITVSCMVIKAKKLSNLKVWLFF